VTDSRIGVDTTGIIETSALFWAISSGLALLIGYAVAWVVRGFTNK
jgi:hypothetical protein